MKSTLHGTLQVQIELADGLVVSMRGLADICTVRGTALGQPVNLRIALDTEAGELLLFSPDMQPSRLFLGDLIAGQIAALARAQAPRREVTHA